MRDEGLRIPQTVYQCSYTVQQFAASLTAQAADSKPRHCRLYIYGDIIIATKGAWLTTYYYSARQNTADGTDPKVISASSQLQAIQP